MIFSYFCAVQFCAGQCFINKHLTTKPAMDKVYQLETIDLQDMFVGVMNFVAMIKDELPVKYGNLSVTQPGDASCPILGEGISLQHLTTQGKSMLNTIPVLTDILSVGDDRFIISSVHLNKSQFQDLLEHLSIELHLVEDAPPQLFLFKDHNDQLHLKSFSLQEHNACLLGIVSKNIHHSLQNTLQLLQNVFYEVQTVLSFYGSDHLYGKLGSCLQLSNITLQSLIIMEQGKFDFCVKTISNSSSSVPRVNRRSTLLSWILGEGAQMDTIEVSLKDSIKHFNENFAKVSIFDGEVVESFNRLEMDVAALVEIEQSLQEQITDLSLFVRLQNIKTRYEISRIQHAIALYRILQESKLISNLQLLTRALFGANECHLQICETSISPEQLEMNKVRIHREIVQLLPVEVALVSCMATESVSVPLLHDQLADITGNGRFLIESKLYTKESLQNTSVVNTELYPLPPEAILLGLFHHYSNNSQLYVQCLEKGKFQLNEEQNVCSPLKFFPLHENFVLKANGGILRSQMLIQKSNLVKTAWMQEFSFSNIPIRDLPDIPQFTFLHPTVEKFFVTPAGELHVENTSYVVITVVACFCIIMACCCAKNIAFRTFFITKFNDLKTSLYIKMTTEEYRDKKQCDDLNKKINKNWSDIGKMEALIAKKAALQARLPVNSSDSIAPSYSSTPSAPAPPPSTHGRATVEIHHQPSHSGAPLGSTSNRKN